MNLKLSILLFALTLTLGYELHAASGLTSKKTQAEKTYVITAYGAVGDGKTLNTKAIQTLINTCAEKGGGCIVIPKGVFLTGSLFFKKGVNLEIQKDAVLKGSVNINDYKRLNTRIEGHFEPWRAALINADHADHFSITGPGTLDGSGEPFYKLFYSTRERVKGTKNLDVERPRLTLITNSKHVKVSGVHFLNSGFWNLHLYRCQDVVVENCSFIAPSGPTPNRGPSSDGIDVDSSQDVTIKGCYFSIGDDCIALKGSKGPFAMQDKDSPPVERIKITDCIFEAGGGIVTFGSEATIVRDVQVERCTTRKPTVLRLKLRPDTPQQYENIRMNDITLENGSIIFKISPWTQYFDLKGQEPPKCLVQNIRISNIRGSADSFGIIQGHENATIRDILLKDADLSLKKKDLDLGEVENLRFENVKVNGEIMNAPVSSEEKK